MARGLKKGAAVATTRAPAATSVEAPAPPVQKSPITKRTHRRRRPTVQESGPHAIDLRVGGRIRLARILAGKTQQWLGEKVRLTFQQIQKYERGANRVSCSMLHEFAVALEKPPAWFFEAGDGAPEAKGDPVVIERHRLTYELTNNFAKMRSDGTREHLVALVRALGESDKS